MAGVKCVRGSKKNKVRETGGRGEGEFTENLAGHCEDFWKQLEGFKQSDMI